VHTAIQLMEGGRARHRKKEKRIFAEFDDFRAKYFCQLSHTG
jgi:hypothetical protein